MTKILLSKFLFLPIFFISAILYVSAQTATTKDSCFNNEIGFVHYLADAEKTKLALLALQDISCGNTKAAIDSINYLKGLYNFSLKQIDSASFYFLHVSELSFMFTKSRFLAAYGLTYTKQYDSAKGILTSIPQAKNDSLFQQLKNLELSGINLLQRDTIQTQSNIASFSYSFYAVSDQQKDMKMNLLHYVQAPKKSAFVAAALSAVLPGAGRFYAGRKKQALGSFIQMAALGLLTWEAYHKHGPTSAPFYIFGSAFTVFYLSNIYGSAVAVKIKKNETNAILDNRILLDLHIPLRSIFN